MVVIPPDEAVEILEVPALTTLTTGSKAAIKVKLRRGKNVVGPTEISVRNLPGKIVSIDGKTETEEGDVTLDVAADAKQGPFEAVVEVTVVSSRQKISKPLKLFVRGPAGTVDTTFGENGATVVPFGPTDNAVGYDMIVAPDDSIILSSACTRQGVATACYARLNANGTLDQKFDKNKGAPYAYGRDGLIDNPRSSAYSTVNSAMISGGTKVGSAAVGAVDKDGFVGGLGADLNAPSASNNGAVYGLAVRNTDGNIIAAFETTGTTSFAVALLGLAGPVTEFGLMGYSTGLTFGTTSSAPMAAGILKSGDFFVLGVGKTSGTSYFGIVTLNATTGAKTGGTSIPVPGADRGGTTMGYAQLADGSIVTGTGVGNRVLKFLPDGSGLDPTFSTEPIVGKTICVAADAAGRILVLGAGNSIVRLTPQGATDATFPFNFQLPSGEQLPTIAARRIALQKDGRIILGTGTGAVRIWN